MFVLKRHALDCGQSTSSYMLVLELLHEELRQRLDRRRCTRCYEADLLLWLSQEYVKQGSFAYIALRCGPDHISSMRHLMPNLLMLLLLDSARTGSQSTAAWERCWMRRAAHPRRHGS